VRPPVKVDSRTAQEIAAQVRELLPVYVPHWQQPAENKGPSEALIGIFARYCEILIDRLNRVPEKNLLAFLNFLGASQAPVQAARVPLTFYLAGQSGVEAVVPALTQVAALPAPGEKESVVFETERDLVMAPAWLDSLWVRDNAHDRYADYRDLLDQTALLPPQVKLVDLQQFEQVALRLTGNPPSPQQASAFTADTAKDKVQTIPDRVIGWLPAGGVRMFSGNRAIDHFLFIAIQPAFSSEVFKKLRLKFVVSYRLAAPPDAFNGPLEWALWNGSAAFALDPDSDTTQNLTHSGDVEFTNFPLPPPAQVNGRNGYWLRVSWKAPDTTKAGVELPAADALPLIQTVTVTIQTEQKPQQLDRAFLNNLPLDLSKDFFPFGERPKFGDTLYLSSPLFSAPGAAVTLAVKLTNPLIAGSDSPVPPVKPNAPRLQWEAWNGAAWTGLGTSEFVPMVLPPPPPSSRLRIDQSPPPPPVAPAGGFSDGTQAFVESGNISFRLPARLVPCLVGGQSGYWIRVRLASGDYGHDVRYELEPGKGFVVTPATFAPPVINLIQAQQELTVEGPPAAAITYNDFTYRDTMRQPFSPFEIGVEPQPSCYLGLSPMDGRFPGHAMSFYFGLVNQAQIDVDVPASGQPFVIWEYWNGMAWTPQTVQDETACLRHSGLIQFLAPEDFSAKIEFGEERFWLRARKADGSAFEPVVRRILLNTVMATQTQTTAGEILGSASGGPNQVFRTARKPVLEGQILEILEPTPPSASERHQIEDDEGPDAITETPVTPAGRVQAWVTWHEMPNFECSGPRDRHYVINRDTGEVAFGSGVAGLVPPAVTGNVRMAKYRTGGGSTGNKPIASIAQLKTTVPYVARVTNFEPADGGADVETIPAVLDRMPREIRHGGRAVTPEDFEDLAQRASLEVARAKCFPVCDLELNPDGTKLSPGVISLVVVPRWADGAVSPAPPTAELFGRVREFLDQRRLASVKLVLAAPDYIGIDVKAEITVKTVEGAGKLEIAVKLSLCRFLHPLTGFDGSGWAFGRLPTKSDLYRVIENVPGVEHVRSVQIAKSAGSPDAERFGRFLIYAGDVQLATTLET
jgi:hypothetical protein